MDASVTWKQRLTFTGKADSGFEVTLGTDAGVGGDDDGFRPMEMIVTGLAGCTAMDVISILQKKKQDITAFEVRVHADRAKEHPKVITSAEIEYIVSGHKVDEDALLRAIELSATRYCPAQAMFAKVFPIRLVYQVNEDENGTERLVTRGEYSAVVSE